MSWDATLAIPRLYSGGYHTLRDWNYTHNTSKMIYLALDRAGLREDDNPWWNRLNELSGVDGSIYLSTILQYLASDRPTFVAMNPENGWGDYDTLLDVLIDMRDWGRDFPGAVWSVSG